MFMYANLKKAELEEAIVVPPVAEETQDVPYPDITRIDAKHYFIDGVHTLVGELTFPTPCDLLQTDARVMESYPEQVIVDFTVINNADMCTQVITNQRFRVDFTAANQASISARFMGRDIELNLIPAGPEERPEDFELFIKG